MTLTCYFVVLFLCLSVGMLRVISLFHASFCEPHFDPPVLSVKSALFSLFSIA